MLYPMRLKPDVKKSTDKDSRDLLASAPVVTPTGDVSLQQYCIPMDQLSLNACAGNASAESEEVLSNIAGFKPTPVSRLFIYNLARNEMGDLGTDSGTTISDCFDVLTRLGVSDEYLWPYDLEKVFTLPSIMAMRQALGHRISGAYRIVDTTNPLDRVDSCIAALRSNHPVVFGTSLDNSFYSLNSSSPPQKPPTGAIIGRHAMVIVGWVNGAFVVKNSWGTTWGNGGFCLFDPTYIWSSFTSDLWVPTLALNFTVRHRVTL